LGSQDGASFEITMTLPLRNIGIKSNETVALRNIVRKSDPLRNIGRKSNEIQTL